MHAIIKRIERRQSRISQLSKRAQTPMDKRFINDEVHSLGILFQTLGHVAFEEYNRTNRANERSAAEGAAGEGE